MSHSQTVHLSQYSQDWRAETVIRPRDGETFDGSQSLTSGRFLSGPKLLMTFRPVSHHCLLSGRYFNVSFKTIQQPVGCQASFKAAKKVAQPSWVKMNSLISEFHLPSIMTPKHLFPGLVREEGRAEGRHKAFTQPVLANLTSSPAWLRDGGRWGVGCRDRLHSRLAPGLLHS